MVNKILDKKTYGFEWLDIVAPSDEEFDEIAKKYKLHPELVNDCLQPDHLPKFERLDNYSFLIFRIHNDNDKEAADSVQELTNKIAIFYSDNFLLTIHRKKQTIFDSLKEAVIKSKCENSHELLSKLVAACLNTYDEPLKKLTKSVDYYEEIVFLRPKNAPLLKGLYYLKRKIDLLKQMLILSYDIIDNIDSKEQGDVYTRNLRDQYVKFQNMFSSYSENIHQLLNIYFSASSQRTNETIRVLTIFSVFFMPLTFIVGIYGMNFEFMPELKWKFGYPGALLLMAAVTALIYIWFKRKKWL